MNRNKKFGQERGLPNQRFETINEVIKMSIAGTLSVAKYWVSYFYSLSRTAGKNIRPVRNMFK